jgi:hypothetical protein
MKLTCDSQICYLGPTITVCAQCFFDSLLFISTLFKTYHSFPDYTKIPNWSSYRDDQKQPLKQTPPKLSLRWRERHKAPQARV